MIRLLIADDEPLVLLGLQSMLDWKAYDIEICGTARTGAQVIEMVGRLSPDLVICDIKMPVKTGLEALEECRKRYGARPLFIMLTSFEEFDFARKALSFQAADYLIKIELTPEILAKSIAKAVGMLCELPQQNLKGRIAPTERFGMQRFHDRFFARLFNNLIEGQEQFIHQQQELGLDFSFAAYAVCYCAISSSTLETMTPQQATTLHNSTVRIVWDTVTRYMACYVTSLDMHHFCITFCLSEQEEPIYEQVLRDVLDKACTIVFNYFNVHLQCAIGCPVQDAFLLARSYSTARGLAAQTEQSPAFSPADGQAGASENIFDFSASKERLRCAFEEQNADLLDEAIGAILEDLQAASYPQVMDAACSLLYMASNLLYGSDEILAQIFEGDPGGYRSLYRQHSTAGVLGWIRQLRGGLSQILRARKVSYKERIIQNVQAYIQDNLDKRLALSDVAAVFGFTPNYLSKLFTRSTSTSFVEYTTNAKINRAKELLASGKYKVYEVAEQLGFENAFYFSKVFRKITGQSPREYSQGGTE